MWCSRPRNERTKTAEVAARQRPRHGGTMGAVEHRRRAPSRTTTAVARAVPPTSPAVTHAGAVGIATTTTTEVVDGPTTTTTVTADGPTTTEGAVAESSALGRQHGPRVRKRCAV